ncbi:NAD(P)-binding protein [Pseudovirgaria hyperparasitica]|uniref:NAD(P)-binding protein n=1 Tax=Pseudovirgaria hyperparasitica TaxID=470096 RepID=A0A6A6W5I4_9PEZI|nr:NAD(P)-binding protein [Pseudovirgaria hyperparasitica]KAF2757863.1 NAD(P)-binding protein [Pseudovirgaria hyperparasitica]
MTSETPVWLITATSNGFGKGIAELALARGHRVIATARNTAKIAGLKESGASTLALDVTWPLPQIKETVKEAQKIHGSIDILVNAAGYILEGAVEETSPEETLATFNTNVLGMLNVTRAVLPYMRAQRSGVMAIFGSLGSWTGGAGFANYAATKWSCSAIAESLRPELEGLGITATVIEPGYFRSNFLSSDAKVKSEVEIQDYTDTATGEVRRLLAQVGGNQPGDVKKGCEVIVDVLTGSGETGKKGIPPRLVLGSDCQETIREKCRATLALLDEWKDISYSTDYAKGQRVPERCPGTVFIILQ